MNLTPGTQRLTTTDTQIGRVGQPVRVFAVNLLSGSSASTVSLRNGSTASDNALDQVDGIANQSVSKSYNAGLLFPQGCFVDVDANTSYCDITFSTEA